MAFFCGAPILRRNLIWLRLKIYLSSFCPIRILAFSGGKKNLQSPSCRRAFRPGFVAAPKQPLMGKYKIEEQSFTSKCTKQSSNEQYRLGGEGFSSPKKFPSTVSLFLQPEEFQPHLTTSFKIKTGFYEKIMKSYHTKKEWAAIFI